MTSLDNLHLINNLVLQNAPLIKNSGLMKGKMGISIYLFHLSRKMDETIFREQAENMIDDLYKEVGNNSLPTDFGNGLAGIVWGIDHLIHNGFLDADPDEIFADADDKIFQFITNQNEIPLNLEGGLLGYGFYLLARLKNKQLENADGRDYILLRLLIDIINKVYDFVEAKENQLLEPLAFKITWILPLTLIFLAEVMHLKIHQQKISRILERLSIIVLSLIPIRHSHRLYLATSIEMVLKYQELPQWREHFILLKDNFNPEILLSEFPDKNLTLSEGISGICPILINSNNICDKNELLFKIGDKIDNSSFWNELNNREQFLPAHISLSKGIAGIGLALNIISHEISS